MNTSKFFASIAVAGLLAACNATHGTQLSAVHFDHNSAKLSYEEQALINKVADQIKRGEMYRPTDGDLRPMEPVRVKLVGHTDSKGSDWYNQKLSMKRAEAVRQALIERGVDPSAVEIEAMGKEEALQARGDNSDIPASRRVDIRLVR